jgi:hypothetical protein
MHAAILQPHVQEGIGKTSESMLADKEFSLSIKGRVHGERY